MKKLVERVVLGSRYLLVPLYLALMLVILTITVDFFRVLVGRLETEGLNEHIIVALQLLDITMIANLIWLISAGSYYVFVDKGTSHEDRPPCLQHVTSGLLKQKMAGSLIGVSSVHLLQMFLHMSEAAERVDWAKMLVLLSIHLAFIVGLLAFNHANKTGEAVHA